MRSVVPRDLLSSNKMLPRSGLFSAGSHLKRRLRNVDSVEHGGVVLVTHLLAVHFDIAHLGLRAFLHNELCIHPICKDGAFDNQSCPSCTSIRHRMWLHEEAGGLP